VVDQSVIVMWRAVRVGTLSAFLALRRVGGELPEGRIDAVHGPRLGAQPIDMAWASA
jgi:hypothetical protein